MGNGASPNGLSYRAHSRLYLHYRAEPSNERLVFGGVGSTGRCNTGVKSLRWGFECQSLTWPFVELTSHFVQMGLRALKKEDKAFWLRLAEDWAKLSHDADVKPKRR